MLTIAQIREIQTKLNQGQITTKDVKILIHDAFLIRNLLTEIQKIGSMLVELVEPDNESESS